MAIASFPCPYLGGEVVLTAEREPRIAAHHPDLLPAHRGRIIEVLASPDLVRRSPRAGTARLFSKVFGPLGGKSVVVVVVSDPPPGCRHWVVTAYLTRRLAEGVVEWPPS